MELLTIADRKGAGELGSHRDVRALADFRPAALANRQPVWVEQIYTLAYSKPAIEAVGWWDLSDQAVFWPSGGLLNRQNQPKAAYYRLQGLKKVWGI